MAMSSKRRRSVRVTLMARDGKKCFYCLAPLCHEGKCKATIEHVIAQVAGGSNHLDNLVLACITCNEIRGNMPYEIFIYNWRPVKIGSRLIERYRKALDCQWALENGLIQ